MKKLLPLTLLLFAGCVSEPPPDEPNLFGSCRVDNPDGSLAYCTDFEFEITIEALTESCNNPELHLRSDLQRCPAFNRVARCLYFGGTGHYYPPYTVEQVLRECDGNVEVP
jgi:hypothetical protein